MRCRINYHLQACQDAVPALQAVRHDSWVDTWRAEARPQVAGPFRIRLPEHEPAADGIDVEIEVFPEMWHVFQLFVGKMPESKAAVKKIGAFIQGRFSAPAEAA